MPADTRLFDLGKQLLALVKKADPSAQALVTTTRDRRTHLRFARNEVTTSGENDDVGLSLTVQLGLRTSTGNTNQADAGSLAKLVERTVGSARLSPELPETMPVLGSLKLAATPSLRDPSLASMDAKSRAEGIAQALEPSRSKALVSAGYLELHDGMIVRQTTGGLNVSSAYTDARFSVTARTADGTGSGWSSVSTRQKAELEFARVGRVAAEKALASAKPRALEPGRYTVVLEPAATLLLTDFLFGSLDRRSADEGRSCFAGKLGARVANERITLTSDPSKQPMLPFDGDGLPLQPVTWIKSGVLEAMRVSRFWAKEKKLGATGGHDGLLLAGGESSLPELIKGVKRGLLVTRFWYANLIDAQTLSVTALTRDGTFLIEDGAIAAPVKNFRINQSVLSALQNIDALSARPETVTSAAELVPAVRTHDFHFASTSEAI